MIALTETPFDPGALLREFSAGRTETGASVMLFPEIVDGLGLRVVDSPIYVTGTDKTEPRMAPAVGQHTREILAEVGLSEAEIANLTAD